MWLSVLYCQYYLNGLNQGAQFDSTIISRRLVIRLTLPGPAISIVITYTISYASADPFNLKAVANIFFQFASMIIIFKEEVWCPIDFS